MLADIGPDLIKSSYRREGGREGGKEVGSILAGTVMENMNTHQVSV